MQGANLARERVEHVCELLPRLHLDLQHLRVQSGEELQNLIKDDLVRLTEVLDEEALKFEQLLNDWHHSLQVLLDGLVSLPLIKQVEGVDDADGAADLLHFHVVALDEIVELTFHNLFRNQGRLVWNLGIRIWLTLGTLGTSVGSWGTTGSATLHLAALIEVLLMLLYGQVDTFLTVLRQVQKLVLLSDLLLEVLQVGENRLAEPLREVVVEHFDDSTKVLELLDLGLVGRD